MQESLTALLNGFPVFLAHSSVTLAILCAGIALYVWITPFNEIEQARAGNPAAALSLGAATLGLALPLAFSLAASLSLWEVVFWGLVALVMQLIAFAVVDRLLKDLDERILSGDMAAAILLASIKLATAFVNAAAISG